MAKEKEIEINVNEAQDDQAPKQQHMLSALSSDLSDVAKNSKTATDLLDEIISIDEDKFIPWEEVQLPSKGFYYGDKVPNGIVRVRAMGIHAEKILSTQRLAQTGQSIDYLYKHCVQLPNGFDHSELLSGDRTFLLYVLRGITHGNIYEFVMKCAHCEQSSSHQYDLNELATTIKGPKLSLGDEPFKVDLPYMSESLKRNVWVKIRMVRGKDAAHVANRMRFNKRVNPAAPKTGKQHSKQREVAIDQAISENLHLLIVAFGGEGLQGEVTDSAKLRELVERLHSKDSATIRQYLRDVSPGIDTSIEVQCPNCGAEYDTDLPITETSFRQTSDRKS